MNGSPPEPGIFVHGTGAVSPAGWGVPALFEALQRAEPLPRATLSRPGWNGRQLKTRQVPPAIPRPSFIAHPRLRRASPISHYAVAAALEALGADAAKVSSGEINLGIVVCVMSGCVNYSRRFYDETLRDPATASPLVFPETVFNAPASHLAALLHCRALNYTLVGDPGTFFQGLALAADWLESGFVDACIVIGAEENDWLTADAFRLFCREMVLSDGAGAIYLKRAPSPARLAAVTGSHLFMPDRSRVDTVRAMRAELPADPQTCLVDGLQGLQRMDAAEEAAWSDWPYERMSPKRVLGEGLTASAAWLTIAALRAVKERHGAANISIVGTNQQAIGARFTAHNS